MIPTTFLITACSVAFVYAPRLPIQGNTAHSGLNPPTLIDSQENAQTTCLWANLIEAIPCLKMALDCVK